MNRSLDKVLESLPDKPGVYLMKDLSEKIIYVGKAGSLAKRVRSYFQKDSFSDPKISALVANISNLEYIETKTDVEALILESSLIKKYKPKYNVMYKDDKSYPLLKLTVAEDYPRLFITRRILPDNAKYFGPYVTGSVRKMLKDIYKLFPIRDCSLQFARSHGRACIREPMDLCSAPCIRKISKKEYQQIVKEVEKFLSGKQNELIKEFHSRMNETAKGMEYEEAAKYRDLAETANLLSIQSEHKIKLAKVEKEERKKQLIMRGLTELKDSLKLSKLPTHIEAFDISNFAGKEAVGSMVVFMNGEPFKNGYRHFNIKEVSGIDDFAMIHEIVKRRYTRLIKEGKEKPDLILIDGGIGQLNSAQKALSHLYLNIPLVALAKKNEDLFVMEQEKPIKLPKDSAALHLIIHIRDEAHRFAITHHRKRMRKLLTASELANIPVIGPKRIKALLNYFGSVNEISKASVNELNKVKGITLSVCKKVYDYFRIMSNVNA